jgi:sterol desaturase/sphingolipid hydroxylase (fatty acid hydroxylase superfamily)
MKRFIARHLYAVAVGTSLSAFLAAREFGLPLEAVVLAASLAALLAGALLERVIPFEPAWRRPDGDTSTDATSAVVLLGLVDPALKAAMPLLAIATLRLFDAPGALFPIEWPFIAQVMLALLWVEFAKYWSHRWHHRSAALWWLHALHHGSRRLYWLNNFRSTTWSTGSPACCHCGCWGCRSRCCSASPRSPSRC